MNSPAWIPIVLVALVVAATIGLGIYASRISHTASDFFVAGRAVNVFWNASAISGEYLSAASFMGVAGLVMRYGYDVLWYPVGYATGYLFLLLFIAGPLRRFGAYTIPDFAEGRFMSPLFRKVAVTFVLFIGLFYTMPQMKGAGLAMSSIFQTPYWVGVALVGLVISFNVALGGMKGITLVQAFQYWLKMFAISVPVFVLMAVFGPFPDYLPSGEQLDERPAYRTAAEAPVKAGSRLPLPPELQYPIRFEQATEFRIVGPARKPAPGEDAIPVAAFLRESARSDAGAIRVEAGQTLTFYAVAVTKGNAMASRGDGAPLLTGANLEFLKPARLRFEKGQIAAGTVTNREWTEPFGGLTNKHGYPLLYTFSLIISLIFGTAGLPHILVRFYTNPDGKSARRTTMWVMVLIGVFYMFPAIWGALGRELLPELYTAGKTDSVVIELPTVLGGVSGQIWKGITAAGAFAAFMSTFSGLLVSMAGAVAHDIYGQILRPGASPDDRRRAFQIAAALMGVVATLLGLAAEGWDIALLVGWAFAIAAASYFPLLLLGAWWRGLTMPGAMTGMLTGGLASLAAIVTTMLVDKKLLALDLHPVLRTLMEQPAIWAVPLSLGLMFVVSLMKPSAVPEHADQLMLRLHAPEAAGLSKDYIA